jgi:glycosyltransferase involved in cell wall biosynthesis
MGPGVQAAVAPAAEPRWESHGANGRGSALQALLDRSACDADRAAIRIDRSSAGWQRLPTKVLLTSPVIPPHSFGQAVLIHRLFETISPHDYCLLAINDWANIEVPPAGLPALPGQAYRLPGNGWDSLRLKPERKPWDHVRDLRILTFEALRRARILARIVREEQCGAIIAASGALPDLPAAALASRLTGKPLFIHMFDHWRYLNTDRARLRTAAILEPFVIRQTAGVMCPNEFIGKEIKHLYGIDWTLVRNPSDDRAVFGSRPESVPWPPDDGEIRIVYTGQIQEAHYDAFHNLLSALDAPDLQNVRLHLYTGMAPEVLVQFGFRGRYVHHGFVPAPEIFDIQRHADILFLPLAFNTRFPRLIRDAATSKLGDYLASGRPILIHAPSWAYPCWFAQQHDCGLIVDQPSPDLLADAVRRLRDDALLRQRLGGNARLRADEFSASAARSAMVGLLSARLGR